MKKETLIKFAEWPNKNYEDLKIFSPEWQVLKFNDFINEASSESQSVRDNEQEKEVCCPDCQVPMTKTNTGSYICEDESCTQTD